MSDPIGINRVFHDHECAYYDERFAIVHDARSAGRARQEVEVLLGRPLAPGERVLDVGCGTGWLAAGLRRSAPGVVTVGIDLSAGMLGRARDAGADLLVQAQAEALPVPDDAVDLVVGRGVLHHLPDPVAALREWRRVLAPGGAVVLASEPTPAVETHGDLLLRGLLPLLHRPLTQEEDFWEVAAMAANLHVFDLGDLESAAARAGFAHVRLHTEAFAATLVLTASYVTYGRRPEFARLVPWRWAQEAARLVDVVALDRVLPSRWRHTVVGVLRP